MLTTYVIGAVFTFIATLATGLKYAAPSSALEASLATLLALLGGLVWPLPWLWIGHAIVVSRLHKA